MTTGKHFGGNSSGAFSWHTTENWLRCNRELISYGYYQGSQNSRITSSVIYSWA
jgi:hypothetical protein